MESMSKELLHISSQKKKPKQPTTQYRDLNIGSQSAFLQIT